MDTQQTQEQIGTTNCGKSCSCPWQPRSEEGHDAKEQERGGLECWDSQTAITEPDRYTDEQGVDDVDEEDSADEQ